MVFFSVRERPSVWDQCIDLYLLKIWLGNINMQVCLSRSSDLVRKYSLLFIKAVAVVDS